MSGQRLPVSPRLVIAAVVVLLLAGLFVLPRAALIGLTPSRDPRPNFVLIISDDQPFDSMAYMPLTQQLIFDQGITFTNAYVTTPICCPSRASIFTGMYAHDHGVHVNNDPLTHATFVEYLHQAGYQTGHVGKYLNSWAGGARPEFDWWVDIEGGHSPYTNPTLNVNGSWTAHTGYITYILRDYAVNFIHEASRGSQPFFLLFAPNAPHGEDDDKSGAGGPVPAPGDDTLYLDVPPYRPPNFAEADLSDKPNWVQAAPRLTAADIANLDALRLQKLQTMHALDAAIGDVVHALEREGVLDNTMVVYLNDNGNVHGEHGVVGKFYYEEAIHVPLAIRYPPLIPRPYTDAHLVANIDIAPTIYALAELPQPAEVDGCSLVALMQGRKDWRSSVVLEGWKLPGVGDQYVGLHTDQYVYVEPEGDRPELYDLKADPFQLQNVAADPAQAEVVKQLRDTLTFAMQYGGRHCTR